MGLSYIIRVYFFKSKVSYQKKIKFYASGDGPFKVFERIRDNAYKLDTPSEYQIQSKSFVKEFTHIVTMVYPIVGISCI